VNRKTGNPRFLVPSSPFFSIFNLLQANIFLANGLHNRIQAEGTITMTEIPLVDTKIASDDEERPFGVMILSILQIIGGLVVLGMGGLIFAVAYSFYGLIGIGLIITGLITCYVGYGLWSMQSWAWKWAMVVNGISIVLYLVTMIWPGLILPVIIVIYLNQEHVKRRFS